MIVELDTFWDYFPALIALAIPIVAISGAFVAAGARYLAKMQSEENLHRARMAAIERGVYPNDMQQTPQS